MLRNKIKNDSNNVELSKEDLELLEKKAHLPPKKKIISYNQETDTITFVKIEDDAQSDSDESSSCEINRKLTTVPTTEKSTEKRWKGFLPTEFLSEKEKKALSDENNSDDDVGHGKRLGNTLYATKGHRGYLFRETYPVDEQSDDDELMSTGLYVKMT